MEVCFVLSLHKKRLAPLTGGVRLIERSFVIVLEMCNNVKDPKDFRIKNNDFSVSATNCLVLVIEAVQNVKITFFQQLPGVDRYVVTFL